MSYIQLTPLNVNFAAFTLHLDTFDVTHFVCFVVCVAQGLGTGLDYMHKNSAVSSVKLLVLPRVQEASG